MDADPTTTLKVIPAKFFLWLAKARLNFPVSKRDSQQLTNCPAALAGHTVADETPDLIGADVDRHDQRACFAKQFAVVCLAVACVPLNVPIFRPLVRVSHAVSRGCLVAKGR